MLRKSERLNQFKNFKNLPLLKYGLYVEIDHKYHGCLLYTSLYKVN